MLKTKPCLIPQIFGATEADVERLRIASIQEFDWDKLDQLVSAQPMLLLAWSSFCAFSTQAKKNLVEGMRKRFVSVPRQPMTKTNRPWQMTDCRH